MLSSHVYMGRYLSSSTRNVHMNLTLKSLYMHLSFSLCTQNYYSIYNILLFSFFYAYAFHAILPQIRNSCTICPMHCCNVKWFCDVDTIIRLSSHKKNKVKTKYLTRYKSFRIIYFLGIDHD